MLEARAALAALGGHLAQHGDLDKELALDVEHAARPRGAATQQRVREQRAAEQRATVRTEIAAQYGKPYWQTPAEAEKLTRALALEYWGQ